MYRFFATSLSLFLFTSLLLPLQSMAKTARGSFMILQTSHVYEQPTKQAKFIRLHKGYAYNVVDTYYNRKEKQNYFLIETSRVEKQTNVGFIYENNLNLQTKKTVSVYSLPNETTKKNQDTKLLAVVSIASLHFLGETRTQKSTPYIVWQKVRFTTSVHKQYWIEETAGEFRIDRNKQQLAYIYRKAIQARIYGHFLHNALTGTVDIGNSMRFTLITLGKPDNIIKKQKGKIQWDYKDKHLLFEHKRIIELL